MVIIGLSIDAQKMLLHIQNEINSTGKGAAERVDLIKYGYTIDQVNILIAELKRDNLIEIGSYVSSPITLTLDGISRAEKLQS